MSEMEIGRRHDGRGRPGIAPARQNVENDVGGMDALAQRLGAGGLDFGQTIDQDSREIFTI